MNQTDYFKLNGLIHFKKSNAIRKAIFFSKLKENQRAIQGFQDKVKQDLIDLQINRNIVLP